MNAVTTRAVPTCCQARRPSPREPRGANPRAIPQSEAANAISSDAAPVHSLPKHFQDITVINPDSVPRQNTETKEGELHATTHARARLGPTRPQHRAIKPPALRAGRVSL